MITTMKEAKIRERETSYEEIWAILRETDRLVKETAAAQKETDRLVKEIAAEQKETGRQLGKLGSRFGEMIEYLVKPNILAKFRELGFVFTKISQHTSIKDEKKQTLAEVDITLENGDKVMLVEVKSKPSIDDIKEHLERMEKVRLHGNAHGDTRKYLGAVAGMVFNDNEREFTLKNGFYAIEPSGETFTIIPPPEGFIPQKW
jgi:hypothetical protein